MDYKELTDRLNRTTIKEIGRLLGVELPESGSARCPLPDHDDKTPSFSIASNKTRWRCYGCDRAGGSIDFVKEYQGVNFKDAKNWLAEHICSQGSPDTRFSREQRSMQKSPRPKDDITSFAADPEIYGYLYSGLSLSRVAKLYMSSRGFADEIIEKSGVVVFESKHDDLKELVSKFGYDRVYASGLLSKRSTPTNLWFTFPQGSLLFPFFEQKRIVNLQARIITDTDTYGKWRNLNSIPRIIYNRETLTAMSNPVISICEGIMDTLSAEQLGLKAIGLLGVNTELTEEDMKLFSGRIVELLLDWDELGERKARSLQNNFRSRGIMAIRKERPSPKIQDLNEYLIELVARDATL